MKKTRYSESQIIKVLKEVEGGRTVKAVCREYGIAEATHYSWKSKYGGMEASDIKRLQELEEENRRRDKKRLPNRYPIQLTVPDTINVGGELADAAIE